MRTDRPNFIVVLVDDMGYGDIGCYGAEDIETPNIDGLADAGARLTNYCVAAPTCTASRAALLTGCYPQRIGITEILKTWSNAGLGGNVRTIADVLHTRGYATACVGKWHLGHHREFLPTRHGFDHYFGLPYSNDMWPHHPLPEEAAKNPPLPLIEDERVVEYDPDQSQLTTWYTDRARSFIESNRDRPFFLYLAHSMPHVPLHVSEKFRGKSERGLYGDVVMELDWSVGEIRKTLDELQLTENTLLVFTSDNGPWLEYGNHAGSAGPLREGKWTTFDGGQRIPCILAYPGHIPAGRVSDAFVSEMDFFPTVTWLAGAELPSYPIDGRNVWAALAQASADSPELASSLVPVEVAHRSVEGLRAIEAPDVEDSRREVFLHYRGYALEAVRDGRWKLHLPHTYTHVTEPGADGRPGITSIETIGLELFDLSEDVGERTNVASEHPEVVQSLLLRAHELDRRIVAQRMHPGEILQDGVFDATRVSVMECTGGRVVQPIQPCGRSPKADGAEEATASTDEGTPFLWKNMGVGDALTIGVPIPQDGEYRISMTATGAGVYELRLGERVLAGRMQLTERKGAWPLWFLGSWPVIHGVQRLRIRVADAAAAVGSSDPLRLSLELWNVIFERVD